MTGIDYAILFILLISTAISLVRGFVREVLSLIAWVVAFLLAARYAAALAPSLDTWITTSSLRLAAAFMLIFVGVVLLGALLGHFIAQGLRRADSGSLDRIAGALFGLARGSIVVMFLVLLAGFTPMPEQPWWQASRLLGQFEALVLAVSDWLPAGLAGRLAYH